MIATVLKGVRASSRRLRKLSNIKKTRVSLETHILTAAIHFISAADMRSL